MKEKHLRTFLFEPFSETEGQIVGSGKNRRRKVEAKAKNPWGKSLTRPVTNSSLNADS